MESFQIASEGIIAQGVLTTGQDLLVRNGSIVGLAPAGAPVTGFALVRCPGFVAPAYVDIHTHGFSGVSFADASPQQMDDARRLLFDNGVGAFLASFPSIKPEQLARQASALRPLAGRDDGDSATLMGVHLEGPYLSMAKRGAHEPALLRKPDADEMQRWLDAADGTIRQVTLAPDVDGNDLVARRVLAAGAVVALGHTDATLGQALTATAQGYSHVTHLWNGMSGMAHREGGAAAAVLAHPSLTAEVIADGVHIDPPVVRATFHALGPTRMCLITDAVAAAGRPDGEYALGHHTVYVRGGVVRTAAGTLAGSTLTMEKAVRNIVAWGVAPLPVAVMMASQTPARAIGRPTEGVIAPGAAARLNALGPAGELLDWPVRGRIARR